MSEVANNPTQKEIDSLVRAIVVLCAIVYICYVRLLLHIVSRGVTMTISYIDCALSAVENKVAKSTWYRYRPVESHHSVETQLKIVVCKQTLTL